MNARIEPLSLLAVLSVPVADQVLCAGWFLALTAFTPLDLSFARARSMCTTLRSLKMQRLARTQRAQKLWRYPVCFAASA
jgi:hypothetical protein